MKSASPKITVLMPVYNGEKYLREAIDSILNQTFKDFEFLIINDGSTDNSVKIIGSYKNPRIRLIHNEKNLGLIFSLNRGLNLACGEYIARMDCDDISLPERLLVQVNFMEKNPQVSVCGSWTKIIGRDKEFINKYPLTDEELRARLLFNTPLAHPTIIIRKEIIKNYGLKYDENYKHAEDYQLWARIIKYTKISNIPKVLLLYRMHQASVSADYSAAQKENSNKVRLDLLKQLNLTPTEKELSIHASFSPPDWCDKKTFLNLIEVWLNKILLANQASRIYSQKALQKIIADRWLNACSANSSLGLWTWKKYRQAKFSKSVFTWDEPLKLFAKCLIKK